MRVDPLNLNPTALLLILGAVACAQATDPPNYSYEMPTI